MKFHRKNDLIFLTFDILGQYPEIIHGIFTRCGGLSEAPFDSLNIGLSTRDRKDAVLKNRDAISSAMNDYPMALLSQVHGTHIHELNNTPADCGENGVAEADGIVTDTPGRLLAIQVADCQSIMLYDPVNRVAGNVHAGWRGSIGNISAECIAKMKHRYGSRPEDLAAGIGPSLGPCCAEFVNYRDEIPEEYWKYKDYLDRFNFWRITSDQLVAAGMKPDRIECANICTKCNPHLFFSYRQSNRTGRFAAVIGINKS